MSPILTRIVVDTVVVRVNTKEITNSKLLRKLRTILRESVAKAHFLAPEDGADSAMLRVAAPMPKKAAGLVSQLDESISCIRRPPWTALNELRGDPELPERRRQAEELMRSQRETLEGQT